MSQIIKAFTGIFIVLFMAVTSMGIIGVFLRVLHAQNLHASVVNELENSDYARQVCVEALEIAEVYGYELKLVFYEEDGTSYACQEVEDIPSTTQSVIMAEVLLTYPVEIPFFGVDTQQTLIAYAR